MKMPIQTRTREDSTTRRMLIVDEAVREIGTLGSRGFTIQGLARRCGLSNAGLLYYFSSKDALLLEVIDEIERRESDAMSPFVAAAASDCGDERAAYDAMVQVFRRIAERISECPEQGRFIMVIETEASDTEHPAHRWFCDRIRETEELALRLVSPWVENAPQVARIIVAMFHGLSRRWLSDRDSFDLGKEFADAVRSLIPPPRVP